MHPELLSSLAIERRRDLDAAISACCAPRTRTRTARRGHALARKALLPRFRVSWTHTTLAAVSGRRRGTSLVIVISATRTS
jgi:hypothetical protein